VRPADELMTALTRENVATGVALPPLSSVTSQPAAPLPMTPGQRQTLESIARSQTAPHGLVVQGVIAGSRWGGEHPYSQ
jgi:hypothetical protein